MNDAATAQKQPDQAHDSSLTWLDEHNAAVDRLIARVPSAQAGIAKELAAIAKDDMGSEGKAPGQKVEPLERAFDKLVEKSRRPPIEQLALEAMGRELFLNTASGLKQSMDKVESLNKPGGNELSRKLFEEFRSDVLALAKNTGDDLTEHIHVAQGEHIPEVDDSDVVIAKSGGRVSSANGLIVVAADGDVRAHIGGGSTLVIGGADTKLSTDEGDSNLPTGTHVYRAGREVKGKQ